MRTQSAPTRRPIIHENRMNDIAPAAAPPELDQVINFAYEGPAVLTAGAYERWTLRCTPRVDLPPGARIAVAHRWPNDWGIAQADDPAAINYLEVAADDGASVRWWSARLATWHPFDHVLFVELLDGLARGRQLALRFGEGRDGSPGFCVQTFIEEASPQSLRWQRDETQPWREFARHTRRIVGAAPAQLVASIPSRIGAGETFDLHLRLEDRWGNPAALVAPVRIAVRVEGHEAAPAQEVVLPVAGWLRHPMTLDRAGVVRLSARAHGNPELAALSNPAGVEVRAPKNRQFWGDLHGQSLIGCGARSIDAYYAHARDFAGGDFCSHQANCFLVSGDEWQETAASTLRHQRDGQFVTLLGVEWSAASLLGGDHNVYFPGDTAELRRCSHEFVTDKSDLDSDLRHVEDLYRHYRGSDTLIAVHVGGRTASLAWHEPTLDRLLEVHSTHATSEWFLFEALQRGYRMGVIAGSDGVDGRPGNSHPGHMGVRNVRGGLTAILAPELSRAALWVALRDRHCYATTGARILLDFRLGTAAMGDATTVACAAAGLTGFEVRVEGTAPLEQVDFFRGTTCLTSIDCMAAGGRSNRLRVAWNGASAQGNWERARMRWDGLLRVDGARIVAVDDYAFDSPDEGVGHHDAHAVQWRSVTAGDWDGIIVELDRPDAAEVSFVTAPMNLRLRPADIGVAGRQFVADDPRRCVEMRWLPENPPARHFDGRFHDRAPLGGEQAYWVRVRQTDGAYAWSSPIFVTATAQPAAA